MWAIQFRHGQSIELHFSQKGNDRDDTRLRKTDELNIVERVIIDGDERKISFNLRLKSQVPNGFKLDYFLYNKYYVHISKRCYNRLKTSGKLVLEKNGFVAELNYHGPQRQV